MRSRLEPIRIPHSKSTAKTKTHRPTPNSNPFTSPYDDSSTFSIRSVYAKSRRPRKRAEILLENLRLCIKEVEKRILSIERLRLPTIRPNPLKIPIRDVKLYLTARNVQTESVSSDLELRKALARDFAGTKYFILTVDTNRYVPDDDEVDLQLEMRGVRGVPYGKRRRRLGAVLAAEVIRSRKDENAPMRAEMVGLLSCFEVTQILKQKGLHSAGYDDLDRRTLRKCIAKEWKKYRPPPYAISEELVDDDEVHQSLLRRGLSTQGLPSILRRRLGISFAKESVDRDATMRDLMSDLQRSKIALILAKRRLRDKAVRAMRRAEETKQKRRRQRDDNGTVDDDDEKDATTIEDADAASEVMQRGYSVCRRCDVFLSIDGTQQSVETYETHKTVLRLLSSISQKHRERIERKIRMQNERVVFEYRMQSLDRCLTNRFDGILEPQLREARERLARATEEDQRAMTAARVGALRSLQASVFAHRYAQKATRTYSTLKQRVEAEKEKLEASRERIRTLDVVLNRALNFRRVERLARWGQIQGRAKIAEKDRYVADASEVRAQYESMADLTRVVLGTGNKKTKKTTTTTTNADEEKDAGVLSSAKHNGGNRRRNRIVIPRCSRGHSMLIVGGAFGETSKARYPKFTCDVEHCALSSQSQRGLRWNCERCGVDFCVSCYPYKSHDGGAGGSNEGRNTKFAAGPSPVRRTLMFLSARGKGGGSGRTSGSDASTICENIRADGDEKNGGKATMEEENARRSAEVVVDEGATTSLGDDDPDIDGGKRDVDLNETDICYDELALLSVPVSLLDVDYKPTWYHDVSHIEKQKHGPLVSGR